MSQSAIDQSRHRKADRASTNLKLAEPPVRSWEIDFLRGIAVVFMIGFHLCYDLFRFGHWQVNITNGFFKTWVELDSGLFLFLVGVGIRLSPVSVFRRAAKIGAIALGLTMFTMAYDQ